MEHWCSAPSLPPREVHLTTQTPQKNAFKTAPRLTAQCTHTPWATAFIQNADPRQESAKFQPGVSVQQRRSLVLQQQKIYFLGFGTAPTHLPTYLTSLTGLPACFLSPGAAVLLMKPLSQKLASALHGVRGNAPTVASRAE